MEFIMTTFPSDSSPLYKIESHGLLGSCIYLFFVSVNSAHQQSFSWRHIFFIYCINCIYHFPSFLDLINCRERCQTRYAVRSMPNPTPSFCTVYFCKVSLSFPKSHLSRLLDLLFSSLHFCIFRRPIAYLSKYMIGCIQVTDEPDILLLTIPLSLGWQGKEAQVTGLFFFPLFLPK